jgi:dolichyl-phosphate beta-glucosyltransferase
MDPESIADLINIATILLLILTFIYIFWDRFISDITLYDLLDLPPSDPRKISHFIEPKTSSRPPIRFPSVFDPPSVYVTLVIPVENDQSPLATILKDAIGYFTIRQAEDGSFSWEIIVVDNGSAGDVVLTFGRQHREIRLLRLPQSIGKGEAVQAGCLHARGKLVWMLTPECAPKLREFDQLEVAFLRLRQSNEKVVVVASRAEREIVGERLSKVILEFFTAFVGLEKVSDAQCGFKLFSREAAQWLFPNQHVRRWCFGPELLLIAEKAGMEIAEVPIDCPEPIPKLSFGDLVHTVFDLLQTAIYHRVGVWSVHWKGRDRDKKPVNSEHHGSGVTPENQYRSKGSARRNPNPLGGPA